MRHYFRQIVHADFPHTALRVSVVMDFLLLARLPLRCHSLRKRVTSRKFCCDGEPSDLPSPSALTLERARPPFSQCPEFRSFRAGGGYSVPLLAAQSRHEKPYPPMSKIKPIFPFTIPLKGMLESISHSPAGFKREMRFLEIVRERRD